MVAPASDGLRRGRGMVAAAPEGMMVTTAREGRRRTVSSLRASAAGQWGVLPSYGKAGTTPGVRAERVSGGGFSPPSPGSDDARRSAAPRLAAVDEVERLLRRLALNDEESVGMVLTSGRFPDGFPPLVPKVDLLVRLGAL